MKLFKIILSLFFSLLFSACYLMANEKERSGPDFNSVKEKIKEPSSSFKDKYLLKVNQILSNKEILRWSLSEEQVKMVEKNKDSIQWKINFSDGYFCSLQFERCFAINYKSERKVWFFATAIDHVVVINDLYIRSVKDDQLILMGLIHEALGAILGPIDNNYQVSLLIWYLDDLRRRNKGDEFNQMATFIMNKNLSEQQKNQDSLNDHKNQSILMAGGISSVGGGDLASMEIKKHLLLRSLDFFKKTDIALKESCSSLSEFQFLILNMRVELSPYEAESLEKVRKGDDINIPNPYWSKIDDAIFISRFSLMIVQNISDYLSRYADSLLNQLAYERGCDEGSH